MSPQEAFGVALIVALSFLPVIVVGVVYYLKKRLEHKQIMAAIEKGTPLSELRPPKQNGALWIRNLTIGIALLIIGLGWIFLAAHSAASILIALILIGVGIAWIVRGVLNRKYTMQTQAANRGIAGTNQNPATSSASEAMPQTVDQPKPKH
jgi:uncharacterized membrane protein YciS (DUF1049 family)